MSNHKFAWIKSPDINWNKKKEFITTALESDINTVLDFSDIEKIHKLGNINVVGEDKSSDILLVGINGEGDGTTILSKNLDESNDLKLVKELKSQDKIVASYIEIDSKNHEQLAVKIGKIADYIILVGKDWTVIPLENIIADLQDDDVKIIAAVNTVDEAKLAFETLEVGTDGVLFTPKDFNQIKEIAEVVNNAAVSNFDLVDGTITDIKDLISGDRVCIDTASMLNLGEGMLIGSYSKGLFLVHSETLESEYVASRPFRVNAGPVQAYVMGPNNKTKYLSEIKTGDELLAVNKDGIARTVLVGRVKIEKRPFILIEAEYENVKIKTLLQNAETIRLVSDNGEAISVSNLKIGDKVKIYLDKNARHFGMAIKESIIEK
ncbi:MAG: 3-dehydroquinate synthase II [Methanobrevibacter sp.]|jgi:3-dehydroquinate synthase II|nr:3-dehydroquinate synthase II [Candidatus Methanoflexus mossambicus]